MTRRLLTNRRALWAAQRGHNGVFRGLPLRYPAPAAERYQKRLNAAVERMRAEVKRELLALFRHPDFAALTARIGPHGMDAISPASQARILAARLRKRWEQIFKDLARPAAEGMVGQVDRSSKTSCAASLRELSGGLSIKTDFISGDMREGLKASIAENVSLIKSIPSEYFTQIEGEVMRSITTGRGIESLSGFLEKRGEITRRRAVNIALDQTRKVYNNLNSGRMQASGIEEFEWIHSGGGLHPRPLHQAMDGKIYRFDNLPVIDKNTGERGIPGQLPFCGCTMRPILRLKNGSPI